MKRHVQSLAILTVFIIFFCGCSSIPTMTESSAVCEVTDPKPVETVIPTTLPTAPESTALVDADDDAIMSGLDKQISDFLNKTGQFSEDTIIERAASLNDGIETELGIIELDYLPPVIAWLFDYRQQDEDYLRLIVGFDGVDNQRFVTALAVPLYSYDGDMSFLEFYRPADSYEDEEYYSLFTLNDICGQLDRFKNSPLLFYLSLEEFDDDYESYDDISRRLFEEFGGKLGLTQSLISVMAKNGVELDFSAPEGQSIVKITSEEDIDKIDISNIPIITSTIQFSSTPE